MLQIFPSNSSSIAIDRVPAVVSPCFDAADITIDDTQVIKGREIQIAKRRRQSPGPSSQKIIHEVSISIFKDTNQIQYIVDKIN